MEGISFDEMRLNALIDFYGRMGDERLKAADVAAEIARCATAMDPAKAVGTLSMRFAFLEERVARLETDLAKLRHTAEVDC